LTNKSRICYTGFNESEEILSESGIPNRKQNGPDGYLVVRGKTRGKAKNGGRHGKPRKLVSRMVIDPITWEVSYIEPEDNFPPRPKLTNSEILMAEVADRYR